METRSVNEIRKSLDAFLKLRTMITDKQDDLLHLHNQRIANLTTRITGLCPVLYMLSLNICF